MAQLLKFLLVGLANTGVGLLCIWGAMWFLQLNEVAANFFGYAIGLGFSFTLNRSWTFTHSEAVSHSFPRWLVAAMLAYVVNLAIVLLALRLAEFDPYLAQPLGIGAYTAIMFLAGRFYVFRARPPPLLQETN
jgi:putative flippase GtrA